MKFSSILVAGAFAVALPSLYAPSAAACGGFFCDNSAPVLQAGENIIFAHGDDGITAVVQVQYTGEADAFSWLVPVPGIPTVGVSSNSVFTQVGALTAPVYALTRVVEGDCTSPPFGVQDAGEPEPGPDVEVVASGTAGPYVYEVISVDPGLPNIVDVATAWLATNGYEVTGEDVLGDYLSMGMNLVGFKLQNGEDVSAIRPITLRYTSENPMVPIRLTAVAATPAMGVRVWTLGANRHVPVNYRSLVLNEARINWFSPFSNYNDLVDEAAEEAGGHGFVVESAGSTAIFDELVWSATQDDLWSSIVDDTGRTDGDVILSSISLFAGLSEFFEVGLDQIPAVKINGTETTAARLIGCPGCMSFEDRSTLEDLATVPGFDRAAFFAAVAERVTDPLKASQELLSAFDVYTRHYTSMGPDDMDEDPIFEENAALPTTVDRIRRATLTLRCGDEEYQQFEAPWTLELANGQTIEGQYFSSATGLETTPANAAIEQEAGDGPTVTVIDNTDDIGATLATRNASFTPRPSGDFTPEPEPDAEPEPEPGLDAGVVDDAGTTSLPGIDEPPIERRDGIPFCMCVDATGTQPIWSVAAFFALAFAVTRRRRRHA